MCFIWEHNRIEMLLILDKMGYNFLIYIIQSLFKEKLIEMKRFVKFQWNLEGV